MNASPPPAPSDTARRMEELGRIILAYSEVTEKLQQSHDQLKVTVETLRAELGEKNRLLERRNRLAALGEMAAGMAHEIRNPLGGIQLYASLLAKDVADRPDSLQVVQKITGGVKRLEALVGQVLQFTREIRPSLVKMDLSVAVSQAVEYASHAMAERAICCEVHGPVSLEVIGDPLLIEQAVLNLLLNAAEAMDEHPQPRPGGRKITVRFMSPPADSDAGQFHLVVRDNGPGIPPQVLDRIFNPFFTTKDTGTGLGLAIVHRAIEAHDGTIIVTNVEGSGGVGGANFEIRV